MKSPTAVIEAADAILRQTEAGEQFRPDVLKVVQAAYDAGAATSATHIHAVPLNADEIAAFRDFARSAAK